MSKIQEYQMTEDNTFHTLRRGTFEDAEAIIMHWWTAPYHNTILDKRLETIGWTVVQYKEEDARRRRDNVL